MSILQEMLKNLPQDLSLNVEQNTLDARCSDCGKIIHYEIRQRNIKEGPYYCKACAQKHKHFSEQALQNIANGSKLRSGKGICTKCGKEVEIRNSAGLCPDCIFDLKKNKSAGYCSICGKYNETRDQNSRGKECGCSQKWFQKHNSSLTMLKSSLNNLNLDEVGFLYKKDNILYYHSANGNDYLWNDYKILFNNMDNTDLPEGFKFYPTFRMQGSKDWFGAKSAFEQSLVDDNIGWFVYIKLYIDNDKSIKPLVIGKSGSKLVNVTGSDLSFSIDIDDGPARRFLSDNNLNWCKTQIAILKCDNEQDAYEKELFYKQEMLLFGS